MICPFVFFERANLPSIAPVFPRLTRAQPILIRAFDYKEHIGEASRAVAPDGVPMIDLDEVDCEPMCLPATGDALVDAVLDRPYMPLLKAKVASIAAGLERFIATHRPKIAVLPEDTDYARGRLAAQVFRAAGVETIAILPTWYATIDAYPMLGPRLADHYVAIDDATRDRLRAHGAQHVHVLGSAFLDGIVPAQRPETPTFVVALQGKPREEVLVDDVMAIARPEWSVIVRPHPSTGAAMPSMRDLLGRCTAVIAESSIALYEAACAGIATIQAHYGAFPPEMRQIGYIVRDPAELERAMKSAVEHTSPRLDHTGAAQRIARFIDARCA